MNEQQRIGEIIKKARESAALSQGKLATLLGVQNPVIYKYESGKIKVIPFEKRVKLAEILKVPLSDLLYSDEIMEKVREELGINYLNKEYDLLDALAIELEADFKNIDSAEKLEAVKAKFEAFEKKRLELEKGVAMLHELLEEITKKAEELKKAELIQHNN
ncbi:helix-turn-helix domain-containing protein [Phascolarctobacterium succinatutens]|mgnify:CR=1 FL=1|uniref:helix-turn-helix domain-containing protein n=1 Tax=Phascolarctobacterium succinatutens TaxID=626940 RepID=UPI002E765338|nr:helix-turn-helix domain-containing protein [Phascolarctobacterium succinatutens]MEE0509016.1 helix-turn-helix domain-containing protein [Phascolarctobacterium succinatutens]